MKTVLLAGCGKMGTAMLTGWLEGLQEDLRFIVVDPVLAESHPLAGHEKVDMHAGLPADLAAPDLVVLAVKPQMMAEALPPLVKRASAETVWLSILYFHRWPAPDDCCRCCNYPHNATHPHLSGAA